MNKEELYNAIAHIDEELLDLSKNESCDITFRKDKVNNMSKKFNIKKMWLPIAACLVFAFVAIGAFTLGQNKAPVKTPGSESGYVSSATTVIYNNVKYLSIISAEDAEKAGVPANVTVDMVGEHLAYVQLSGDNADYIETAEKTDKEIMQFADSTDNGALILKDGEAYWAIIPVE